MQKMKSLEELRFVNPFVKELPGDKWREKGVRQVFDSFYSFVEPTPTGTDPTVIAYSKEVCDLIELDEEQCLRPEFAMIMSGQTSLPQTQTYAQCYGGHQFGNWAGQLGDGRAINFGEIMTDDGHKWELQLKGVGRTPYSRFADGRAVLRSSLREFVASEALHHLGIPTTRALCLVSTGDAVPRDMFYNGNVVEELGAAVCRVAPTFVRFGTFQLPASRGGNQLYLVKKLTDWVIQNHFPHLQEETEKVQKFFAEVCERTAVMVAKWQAVGFVHGVLNTDNMSILGLTIDYGPFGFVDAFDPQFSPNITDIQSGGRYAFKNQTEICQWNLIRLGEALCRGELMTTNQVEEAMQRYEEVMIAEYTHLMAKKFGLKTYDRDLSVQFMKNLYLSKADFTNSFRALTAISPSPSEPLIPEALQAAFGAELSDEQRMAWMEWITDYKEALTKNGVAEEERAQVQNSVNPKYIPRQHLLQRAIEEAEKGSFSELERLMEVLRTPYTQQPDSDIYCQPPPKEMMRPGVRYLSCSS